MHTTSTTLVTVSVSYLEYDVSLLIETALYLSSFPSKISFTSSAFNRVMLVARECIPKPANKKKNNTHRKTTRQHITLSLSTVPKHCTTSIQYMHSTFSPKQPQWSQFDQTHMIITRHNDYWHQQMKHSTHNSSDIITMWSLLMLVLVPIL